MLRYTLQWAVLALVFNILLNSSCSKDIITEFPTARLIQAENTLFKDTTLCLEQSFNLLLRLEAGLSKMVKLEVYENDDLMSADRLTIGTGGLTSNPLSLVEADQGAVTYSISIVSPSFVFKDSLEQKDTVINYFFRVIDELNQPAVASLAIQYRLPQINITNLPDEVVVEEDTLISVFIGELLNFQVELSDCWKDLEEFSILEDGVPVPTDRLIINRIEKDTIVTATSNSNPLSISSQNNGQVVYDISITQQAIVPENESRTVYAFALSNTREQIGRDTFTVLHIEGKELALSAPENATLTNQADTTFLRGGLDLDSGEEVSITDVLMAEIEDEGIILAGAKWRRQISVVNPDDSEMRQVEGFSASDFTIVQQLERAFNQGVSLTDNDDFDPSEVSDPETGENVSEEVKQGDTFILLRQGIYYFIECIQIKDNDDNSDFYEFAVLY